MVSNLCFNSPVSDFDDFHTHFCSLQQPMRETVGNKNKKRVFCHTCCKKRIYCKEGYLSLFLGEELRMIKVFGHLCSRNHQLGFLFAVGAPETKNNKKIFILGAPETMPRVK